MTLANIVAKRGGDLYANGCKASIPGPGHSQADRSVSLMLGNDGRVVIHSFASEDWREIMDDLRRDQLVDEAERPLVAGGVDRTSWPKPASDRERIAAAARQWDVGRPIADTLSARYLRLRAITRTLPGSEALRHNTDTLVSAYKPTSRVWPALLAGIRAPEGDLSGVEITYLDPNGRRTQRLRLSRKTIGAVPTGSAVRLDPADAEMLVGEGVCTTLSASQYFGLPGWALLSEGNLSRWTPPEGVSTLLIAGDRGRPGENAAACLAGRARAKGVRCLVRFPPKPHGDWNTALQAERARLQKA